MSPPQNTVIFHPSLTPALQYFSCKKKKKTCRKVQVCRVKLLTVYKTQSKILTQMVCSLQPSLHAPRSDGMGREIESHSLIYAEGCNIGLFQWISATKNFIRKFVWVPIWIITKGTSLHNSQHRKKARKKIQIITSPVYISKPRTAAKLSLQPTEKLHMLHGSN